MGFAAPLVRLAARVGSRRLDLARRFPRLALAGDPAYRQASIVFGVDAMPVRTCPVTH